MTNPFDPVRFAIVGCGYIGKRHAEVIRQIPNASLKAICDTDQNKSSLAEELGIPFFLDLSEMLAKGPDFDVLCVASPNGLHAEHAVAGLASDKHVVIEKPMALTQSQCENIISSADKSGKKVFCVMQNRYSPPSYWLKELVTEGILGKIYMVQINCFWNRDERYYKESKWKGKSNLDGGTLFTQFSHFVDTMFWVFGDITNINARFNDFNHAGLTEFEDSGNIAFDFINGGAGTFNYSTSVWDRNLESSIAVIAEKGAVKIGGQYMNAVEYCHIKDYRMPELPPVNPPNDYGHYKGSASNHEHFYANVIDALKSDGQITTNASEGMKVVEIIERIYASNPYFNSKKK